MDNNSKTMYLYKVRFERIWKSWQLGSNDTPLTEISLFVNAENIKAAMDIAWQAVTISPEEYHITLIVMNDVVNRDYF